MSLKNSTHRKTLLPEAIKITAAKVVSGAGRGKGLGIPTLNIELLSAPKELSHGIYACWISFDGKKYKGAMHFGPRPVFKDSDALEVHVLDAEITEPPTNVDLEIIARIRGIENLESVEALKEAIADDIAETHATLLASSVACYPDTSMKNLLKQLFPEMSPIRLGWHRAKAFIAALRYGFPARKLTVLGVTGTDGKTTTVGMIAHILDGNGIKTGALSTAFFQIGNEIRWNPTQKTSPSPFLVQKFLRELVSNHCTHAVLECSSHGLLQSRVNHTNPSVAAITNVSEEHLDYHGTMEKYIDAKAILFRMLRGKGTKVVNADDRTYGTLLKIPSEKIIHISARRSFDTVRNPSENAYWLTNLSATSSVCSATLHGNPEGKSWELSMPIVGNFNLHNALTAIASVRGLAHSISIESIVASLKNFHGVPGRMERIDAGQDFTVLVDFTVTPKSYEATLSTLKAMLAPGKRLLALAGSCGDRMKEKRPVIGKILSNLADVVVITNEDPYTEDPEKIIDDVWAGIDQSTTNAHRIFDRLEAIRFLLKEARPGDIVILCGKGADTMMMLKAGQVPWNEREIAKKELQMLQR